MKQVNIYEARTHLSRLLTEVEAGEEIIIARAGRPVAMLVPYREVRKPRQPGTLRGQIWMADDFDELPEELLAAFEGRLEDEIE